MITSPKQARHVTLVPNRQVLEHRLAAFLGKDRDGSVVIAPGIFVFSSWVEDLVVRIRQLRGLAVPGTLRSSRATWLWQRAVRTTKSATGSGFEANAAAQARSAYRLLKQWREPDAEEWLHDDFFRQKSIVEKYCSEHRLFTSEDWIRDLAALADGADLETSLFPERITMSGFLELTTAETRLVESLRALGIAVDTSCLEPPAGKATVHGFPTREHEWSAALDWARNAMSSAGQRVALVAPQPLLAGIRDRRILCSGLRRAFSSQGIWASSGSGVAFHVSQAQSIVDSPIVADALFLLELSAQGADEKHPFGRISRLLLSPFWGREELTIHSKSRLEWLLRRAGRYRISLREVARIAREAGLGNGLDPAPGSRTSANAAHRGKGVAETLRAWLEEWGWPGETEMDPMGQEAATGLVRHIEDLSGIPVEDPREGIQLLSRACADSRTGWGGGLLAPVQVTVPEVAVAGEFDALWMIGMDTETWPAAVSRNALVPTSARSSIPRMTPDGHIAYYRRLTRALAACAGEVHFSWAREAEDGERGPSPLLREFDDLTLRGDESGVGEPQDGSVDDQTAKSQYPADLEALEEPRTLRSTTADQAEIEGGSGFFRVQAACPFVAVLDHRLKVRFPPAPNPLPGPDIRGAVLHKALEALFAGHLGKPGVPPASSIEDAIAGALSILERAGYTDATTMAVERGRLRRLLADWLAFEGQRAGFRPQEVEARLQLQLRESVVAVRIDRTDRLSDDRTFLVDYKSSTRTRSSKWLRERIQEPQLPLYAVLLDERKPGHVGGVAFGLVVAGDCRFDGYSDDARSDAQGIRVFGGKGARIPAASWSAMLEGWRGQIYALQDEILTGVAENRIYDADIVSYCDQRPVLRIEQGLQWLSLRGADDAG